MDFFDLLKIISCRFSNCDLLSGNIVGQKFGIDKVSRNINGRDDAVVSMEEQAPHVQGFCPPCRVPGFSSTLWRPSL